VGSTTRTRGLPPACGCIAAAAKPGSAALSLWRDAAPARAALVAYVEAVADPNGPDFIPPEDRVAVFNLDGTLFCETYPNYFDYMLLVHRVSEDPDYRDEAGAFERETVRKILERPRAGSRSP